MARTFVITHPTSALAVICVALFPSHAASVLSYTHITTYDENESKDDKSLGLLFIDARFTRLRSLKLFQCYYCASRHS